MANEEDINYSRIAAAIDYLKNNYQLQPSLEELAAIVHLSPSHFQRLFTEWAGTSPKKFLQYISVSHAKQILLENNKSTLFNTSFQIGLSSTSRLHDLFIQIEGMSPTEFKNGGKNLNIQYSYKSTLFGKVIIANTTKGICYIAFEDNETLAFDNLKNKFPAANFILESNQMQENALSIFKHNWNELPQIKLHLKGTDFQLKVWESLLKIPAGKLSTYKNIAKAIGNPNAFRAVGTAIGSNPIAFLIPCHRVIQATGHFGGYMWGSTRKTAIIGWEQANSF